MIQNGFARACLALGAFWVGLHLIGLAMWLDGYTAPSNVVWSLVQSIWSFEGFALKLCLFFLAIIILLFLIFDLTGWVFRDSRKFNLGNHPENSAEPVPATRQIMIPGSKQDESVILEVVAAQPAKPQPPPPTAAELKRRALQQITGKGYLK